MAILSGTDKDWRELWERRCMLDVIAIFLGQVNTNNLYNLVSKHSLAAPHEAAWHLIASLFHSEQSKALHNTWTWKLGHTRESILKCSKVENIPFLLYHKLLNRITLLQLWWDMETSYVLRDIFTNLSLFQSRCIYAIPSIS